MNHPRQNVFGSQIDDPEVRALVDACCDGLATDCQRELLGKRIKESEEVRDYVLAHALMISQLVTVASVDESAPLAVLPAKPDAMEMGMSEAKRSLSPWRLFAIAASISLVVVGSYSYLEVAPKATSVVVGQIRQISGGDTLEERLPTADLNAQEAIRLSEGEYEVVLDNGVMLSLAAPISLIIDNPMHCQLTSGRLTADVPESAKGFRVFTSQAQIVDHGTRFGVAVTSDGATDVAVFEGKVNVESAQQQRDLYVGRAVSVSRGGAMSRMSVVKPDSFENPKGTPDPFGPTITSVSDNIRSSDEMGYYQIVQKGFGEDQQAYVDRVHQWNAMDERGLPAELVGADYIMPFNEDKYLEDIEVTVTLAREADVYVLLDDRVTVPTWLSNDFVITEMSVGMDEGERPGRPEDPRTISRGPGQSIDYRFSVWRRRQSAMGQVTLGGLLQDEVFRSMYGIIAVPVSNPMPRT